MANEFRIIPGTLAPDYCLTTFQQLNVDILNAAQIVAIGSRFYNLGNSEPIPSPGSSFNPRDYPWFDTNDGNWYYWSTVIGLWVRQHPIAPLAQSRQLWVGNLTDLQTYDGGDTNPPGVAAGPMWEKDADFDARTILGPGTLESGKVVAVGDTGGAEKVMLGKSSLPPHAHIVPLVNRTSLTSDPTSGQVGTVQYGIGKDLDDGQVVENTTGGTRPRAFPLTSTGDTDPSSSTQDKVDLMPPYRGVYIIKRTDRIYIKAP